MDNNIETFGEKLRTLRKSFKMSQEDMGMILGVSKNYISALENDQRTKRSPSEELRKRVEELSVSSILPKEWTSGKVLKGKPSQKIGSTGINKSTSVMFVMEFFKNDENKTDEEMISLPVDLRAYDKYVIEENKYLFYDNEELCQCIMDNVLIIHDVEIDKNKVIVKVSPVALPTFQPGSTLTLRKLERNEAGIAYEIVESRYSEWSKKLTWNKDLPIMAHNGIEKGIFRGYAYLMKTSNFCRALSYVDIKLRADTYLELGTIVTREPFSSCRLASSLIWLIRLMYFSNGCWIGTTQTNKGMLSTINKQKHFEPYIFKDNSHRIEEREGEGESKISVYLCCKSLAEIVYDNLRELK